MNMRWIRCTGVLLLCLYYCRFPSASWLYGVLFLILISLSLEDIRSMEVSSSRMGLLLIIAILICIKEGYSIAYMIRGALAVSGLLWVLYILSKGKAIGGADITFMFLCGIFLGDFRSMLCLFYASIAALPYYLILPASKKELPFIPFLSLGTYLALLYI